MKETESLLIAAQNNAIRRKKTTDVGDVVIDAK